MRSMSAQFESAIAAANLVPALLFEGEFATGTLRLWTGYGTLSWNGSSWAGAGSLIGVSGFGETGDVVAKGTTVSLSGIPTDVVGMAINDARQGMAGRIWLALFAPDGSIIPNPVQAFAGRLDVPEISDNGQTCTVTISYESRLVDLTRARTWRYTHESQQVLYPGDLGFEYVAAIQDKEISWGR